MNTMTPVQTLKGFRDFLPPVAKRRQHVMQAFKKTFERFGFEPLETPALEYAETLMGKYGDEGDKLLYLFEDHGGRKVGLRYDQTVPTARVVAQYGPFGSQELPTPFKRFQMQPVWRAENTQKGRYREFLQCDADCIGIDSPLADAEMLAVAIQAIQSVGIKDLKVLVNDRTIFDGIPAKAIAIIDKLNKIGADGVKTELEKAGYDPTILTQLLLKKPTDRLNAIFSFAQKLGVAESTLTFDPTLARGLDYYTGMIFEITIPNSGMGSVAGGGRYDKLIGMFAGTDIPAVGFAIGFDRIMDILNENPNSLPLSTVPTILVTVFQPELLPSSIDVYMTLLKKGISVELYLDPTAKLEKQLKYADRKSLTHVVVVGPDEVKNGVITLKRLADKQQTTQPLAACVDQLSTQY